MNVQDFPMALQPLVQQCFPESEFAAALHTTAIYRNCADRGPVTSDIGESVTQTHVGLNGTIEHYTLMVYRYTTVKSCLLIHKIGLAAQFLHNIYVLGEQAAHTLDELARNTLFNAGFSGNTRIRITSKNYQTSVAVDDIRGFTTRFSNGKQQPISSYNTLLVMVGDLFYTLRQTTADKFNVSTTPGGISGVLTFTTAITVGDHVAGNSVIAATASMMIRPAQRSNTAQLIDTDVLTMQQLIDAVAKLSLNKVPEIDGAYNCYLDVISAQQLFEDPDFKQLFPEAASANQVFRKSLVNAVLGLRFIPTNDTFAQAHPILSHYRVRRVIICGKAALVEGDFTGMTAADQMPENSFTIMIDDVVMVTQKKGIAERQMIEQSWYWIGGFAAPYDTKVDPHIRPTAANAGFKYAVIIEHIG